MQGVRSNPATHVTKRLCFTVVMFVGVICVSGGYVLGNIARNEARKNNDIISHNLTTASEQLFKKAKRLSPKAVNNHNPEKISSRLLEIFHCDCNDCGKMKNYNVVDFVKNLVSFEVTKLIRTINNASVYMDTLR